MALVNTEWMIDEYTDDFGNKYKNVFFKIQEGAPEVAKLYQKRPETLACGAGLIFKPRHLLVTFNDGRKLTYPVPSIDKIDNFARELKASKAASTIPGLGSNEASCIDLVGESWTNVIAPFTKNIAFKNTPYTNIAVRGIKEAGTYQYTSDVAGSVRLAYAVEKLPADLLACQKEGLKDAKAAKGICSGGGIGLKPRHFIIQALATVDGSALPGVQAGRIRSVRRNANVSVIGDAVKTAQAIGKCAYCLGYQGESIRQINNLVGSETIDSPVAN